MDDTDDRLQAFCSITFDDCFVVRDLKIIEGASGPFVAMPSRKLTSHCPQCSCKNHLRASYCNQCGGRLKDDLATKDPDGRAKLYADIAHPINSQCREMIQDRVITEYRAELERAAQPGYVSCYDEVYDLEEGSVPPKPPSERAEPAVGNGRETTQIEPPQPGPRPPHTAPARRAAGSSRADAPPDDEFGAGIF
jgi:stage V sporulation protein G